MAAEQGRGLAQDGGLHDFARMDHAGGQRSHRHGVDPDDLVLLVQHGDHEVFAVHLAEVLAEEERGLPGTAELGLRVQQTALAHQCHAVDGHTVGPGGGTIWQWEQTRLLRYR
jgi:hypothetical protein